MAGPTDPFSIESAYTIANFARTAEEVRLTAINAVARDRPYMLDGRPFVPAATADGEPEYENNFNRVQQICNTIDALEHFMCSSTQLAAWLDLGMDRMMQSMLRLVTTMKERRPISVYPIKKTLKAAKAAASQRMTYKMPKEKPIVEIPDPETVKVETREAIGAMIDELASVDLYASTPALGLDLEGPNLSRRGDVTIVTIYCAQLDKVYLTDVCLIGSSALTTAGSARKDLTLKDILECPDIGKLMWDCRNDSDALYNRYGVLLGGVVDVQLMECITLEKAKDRKKVRGIAHGIPRRMHFKDEDKNHFLSIQSWGRVEMMFGADETKRMYEETGGDLTVEIKTQVEDAKKGDGAETAPLSTEQIFTQRPLSELFVKYCVADVILLPKFHEYILQHRFWNVDLAAKVEAESDRRVALAKRSDQEYLLAAEGAVHNLAPEEWARIVHVQRSVEAVKNE